jgi:hypothetical protein
LVDTQVKVGAVIVRTVGIHQFVHFFSIRQVY